VSYDPEPSYPLSDGDLGCGYRRLVERCRRTRGVLAIDGPAALPWDRLAEGLSAAGRVVRVTPADAPLEPARPDDPVFARPYAGSLADLVELPARERDQDTLTILLGPGSGLGDHDALWYADVPRRDQLAATRNERRLLYVDWPLEDRHLHELTDRIDAYVDLGDSAAPVLVDGDTLRRTLAKLAGGPLRTRPTFLPGPWGGQWLRRRLGIETGAANLAWSYELIAPEASLLLHDRSGTRIEVRFELLLAAQAEAVLGPAIAASFGGAFPLRFDYLDTFGGGNLSIQCHPTDAYMNDTFGGSYTQHETYYVVETIPGASIYLGLRDDADVAAFERAAREALAGTPFDPMRFLQAHPAEQHRLYLIPGGTPHASGAGNVVLEISATPYLYTLRFYDWLRRGLDGNLRPVHLEHAFANLDASRRGEAVARTLVPPPRAVRSGEDWCELELGALPELFFVVHRLDFERSIADETAGRFHMLCLVAGEAVTIATDSGRRHELSYAETIVVPAAAGRYRLTNAGNSACKVVKAFVR